MATPKESLNGREGPEVRARALVELDRQWIELRAVTPPADLWKRIERRAQPLARPRSLALSRAAAALVGFFSAAIAGWILEQRLPQETPSAAPAHLLERWSALSSALSSSEAHLSFLASVPEYRLLRASRSQEVQEKPR